MARPYFDEQSSKLLAEIIRVDHAGEYGACQIYLGQLATNKNLEVANILNTMYLQEVTHLSYFSNQLRQRKIRPTILLPFWKIIGYTLGKVSAISGTKTAMLCTEGIEEVIKHHYEQQITKLQKIPEQQALTDHLIQFQNEEIEHQQLAHPYLGSINLIDKLFMVIINNCCKIAIFLSEKI